MTYSEIYHSVKGAKKMIFNDYQKLAFTTAQYPNIGENPIYCILGLCGETGEVAEKIKKVIRDNNGKFTQEKIIEIEKELGDVLWYIAALATELNLSLDDIASKNLEKLFSRKKRNKIKGNGDNR